MLWRGRADRATAAATTRSRTRALYTLPEEPTADHRRGGRAEGGRAGGPDRRRPHRHRRPSAEMLEAFDARRRRRQAAVRPGDRVLGRGRGGRAAHRASSGGRTPRCKGALAPGAAAAVATSRPAAAMVTEDDVAEAIVCGPDPERHMRGDRRVRRRRVRPRLRPPGRAGPGGLPPLLRAGDPSPLQQGGGPCRLRVARRRLRRAERWRAGAAGAGRGAGVRSVTSTLAAGASPTRSRWNGSRAW